MTNEKNNGQQKPPVKSPGRLMEDKGLPPVNKTPPMPKVNPPKQKS